MALLYRDPADPPAPASYRVLPSHVEPARLLAGDDLPWSMACVIDWGPTRYRTAFRALWSPAALFLRFDCADDAPWHTMTRRDENLWEEEVVEIFIDPGGCGGPYAEIEINPVNAVCDLLIRRARPLDNERDWQFAGLETRVRHWMHAHDPGTECEADQGWTVTAMLPWDGFSTVSPEVVGRVPPRRGDEWRFNVFRIKRPGGPADPERGAIYAAWSVPEGPSFHAPEAFRALVFA